MIEVMNSASNIDRCRPKDNVSNADNASGEEAEETSGYYYDDTTGYEVFRDENDEDEESPPEADSH